MSTNDRDSTGRGDEIVLEAVQALVELKTMLHVLGGAFPPEDRERGRDLALRRIDEVLETVRREYLLPRGLDVLTRD